MKYLKPKIKYKKIKMSFFLGGNILNKSEMTDGLLLACCAACTSQYCFLPNTNVLMSDKSKKFIEQIKVGDKVLAYNLKAGSLVEETVVKLFIHEHKKIGYFIINNNLKVTGNHPVWVNGTSWKSVDSLTVGDWLLGPNAEKIPISAIEKKDGEYTVYNLGLDGPNNNYFSEDILVHNRLP